MFLFSCRVGVDLNYIFFLTYKLSCAHKMSAYTTATGVEEGKLLVTNSVGFIHVWFSEEYRTDNTHYGHVQIHFTKFVFFCNPLSTRKLTINRKW